MSRLIPEVIDYYDYEVVKMIADKYGYEQMAALRQFVSSKTHEMLEDEENGMTSKEEWGKINTLTWEQRKLGELLSF